MAAVYHNPFVGVNLYWKTAAWKSKKSFEKKTWEKENSRWGQSFQTTESSYILNQIYYLGIHL